MTTDLIKLEIEKLKRPNNEKLIELLELTLKEVEACSVLNINVALGYIKGFFELSYISEYEQELSINLLKKIYKLNES